MNHIIIEDLEKGQKLKIPKQIITFDSMLEQSYDAQNENAGDVSRNAVVINSGLLSSNGDEMMASKSLFKPE